MPDEDKAYYVFLQDGPAQPIRRQRVLGQNVRVEQRIVISDKNNVPVAAFDSSSVVGWIDADHAGDLDHVFAFNLVPVKPIL